MYVKVQSNMRTSASSEFRAKRRFWTASRSTGEDAVKTRQPSPGIGFTRCASVMRSCTCAYVYAYRSACHNRTPTAKQQQNHATRRQNTGRIQAARRASESYGKCAPLLLHSRLVPLPACQRPNSICVPRPCQSRTNTT